MHRRFGIKYHWMNINKPRTFSEKLQWLKTHGDIELKTQLADKYDVRDFVKERIGDAHLVELLPLNKNGDLSITDINDLDWDLLPDQFALKLTKGSGFNIICGDKSKLNRNKVLTQLDKWLAVNNYYLSRESQYKGKNKIIAEKLLEYDIKDYKFFCFDGNPFMLKVDVNRFSGHRANYYDLDWNLLEINEGGCPRDPSSNILRPKEFEEMVNITRILAKGWSFVRIDLYVHEGKVFFGEMTFHPAGGYTPITPREWEYKLGNMIKI
ncbi:MAG: hypothetical protein K2K54_10265 [Lachnospiraceae bacterium]|nr:hypothetical protein [Lachnospiraceae bacterium]